MNKIKRIISIVFLLVLIGCGLGVYYYFYEDSHYFSTENASVSADFVAVTPMMTGKVIGWDVKEGDAVKVGQILGRQDIGTLVTSSTINSQALGSTADSIASKAEIKSPIDGKVVLNNVVKGQIISPGMEIATIADTSNMYIKANVEETSIFKIKQGQKVEIKIDAYPDRLLSGYVERIGQATQSAFSTMPSLNTSGNYSKVTQLIPVKISVVNESNLQFMIGMNANVKISIK